MSSVELNNGDYSITIDKSTLPEGYVITAQNRGDSGALDSDIDPDSGKSDTVPINGGSNSAFRMVGYIELPTV